MAAARSPVPSRAPPVGSVTSARSHHTAAARATNDVSVAERRKSVASLKAPTVIPSDSISQAGDDFGRSGRQSARASNHGGSNSGSQRLTAEALEALSERNSNAGSHVSARTVNHRVEVVEEVPSASKATGSQAASKSIAPSRHSKAQSIARTQATRWNHESKAPKKAPSQMPSKAPSRAPTKPPSAAPTRTHVSAATQKPATKAPSVPSKAASAAPSHRSSRRTVTDVIEVTEPAEAEKSKAKSVAPSRHSAHTGATVEKDHSVAAAALPPPKSVALSQARSRAPSHAPSNAPAKAPTAAPSRHSDAPPAKSVASRAPSTHSTKASKSVASHALSHATSHHSAAKSHATSHHSKHDDSTPPTSPESPTAPQPPPAFAKKQETSSETRVREDMQVVERSLYEVDAPRDTTVDIFEMRRRDGRLMEREYSIAPRTLGWQPAVSMGVANDTVYRKQYRRRRPQRIAYLRRLSSYDD